MASYPTDRTFSDRFIPEIQKIVGPYLLVPASLEQDRCLATDLRRVSRRGNDDGLTLLRARDLMIACRVRRPGYENFWDQFTIRSERENGTKTELRKIIEGFGDWLFYGHAAVDGHSITRWMLVDLAAWRAHLILPSRSTIRHGEQRNDDGETSFHWFDVTSFPPEPRLLIAEYVPESEEVPF